MAENQVPPEDSKAIVERFWEEVVNLGHLHVADELFATRCVLHDPLVGTFGGWGSSQVKNIIGTIRTAFPDISVTIVEPQVAGENEHVITWWTATGTHTGHLNQVPHEPSYKRVEISGMCVWRFTDHHIQEIWLVQDPGEKLEEGVIDWICRHCSSCC